MTNSTRPQNAPTLSDPDSTDSLCVTGEHDPVKLSSVLEGLPESRWPEVFDEAERCSDCRTALFRLLNWLEKLGHYRPHVAAERIAVGAYLRRLYRGDPNHDERLARVRLDPFLHSWALCWFVLTEVEEATRAGDLADALQVAELAVEISRHLDPEIYDERWIADRQAEALANLADVHHRRGDREAARRGFLTALGLLTKGSGRPAARHRVERLSRRLRGNEGAATEADSAGSGSARDGGSLYSRWQALAGRR